MLRTIRTAARAAPMATRGRTFMASAVARINVGDAIPATEVFEHSPNNTVNLAAETAKGKSIVIGVPGAFSGGCTNQVGGYVDSIDALKAKGINNVFVVAVNDAFVMNKWQEATDAEAKLRYIADATGEFTQNLDLLFDATKFFGAPRSKRYALIVEDGKVVDQFVEPDSTGVSISTADNVIQRL